MSARVLGYFGKKIVSLCSARERNYTDDISVD